MPKGDWYCPLCKAVIGEDDERAAAQAAAQLDGATPQGPFEATCAPLGAMNAESASAPSVGAQWEVMGEGQPS